MPEREPPDSERLIAGLRSPGAYPHPVDRVELVETHISWVLLAGEYAYKVKKPVNLGFADFSTLERRRRFCDEEVRLNRRLAPELYLGVVPIAGPPDRPAVEGTGEPIEFAVRMSRFPQDALLSNLVARGSLTSEHIDALAAEVAGFHERIAVAGPDTPFGSPERVWRPAEENFEHLEPGFEEPLARRLAEWSRAEFERRREEFARRKAHGSVRECHGDMHLGNMLLLGGRVAVFDGIEFNDDFRWIDVLSDVAFAVMDVEDRGRPDLARRLLNGYLEATGDYDGLGVLPFYLVYRSMVRAKVASIRSRQSGLSGAGRERQREECRGYLRLAERHSAPRSPLLVVTHGVSGSGKTTASQAVLESLGAVRVRSDVERKRLFGKGPLERAGEEPGGGIYTPGATERTYARLAGCAEAVLRAGFPAVIDAAFLERGRREAFRRLAERLGVAFVILDVRADESTVRERIARRSREGTDASDAGLAVLERQLGSREVPGEEERPFVVEVRTDTPGSLQEAIAAIERVRGTSCRVSPEPVRRNGGT